MDSCSPDPPACLRRVRLRVTASRVAVSTALAASAPHSSVDAVVSAVCDRLGNGSAETVYNVLRTFTDVGLVHPIEPSAKPDLYELRVGDNHHIGCRRCDAIAGVNCAVGDTRFLTAADDSGYEIDEAEVIYWGRCPKGVGVTSVSSGELKRKCGVRDRLGDRALDLGQLGSRATGHQQEPPREEHDQRV